MFPSFHSFPLLRLNFYPRPTHIQTQIHSDLKELERNFQELGTLIRNPEADAEVKVKMERRERRKAKHDLTPEQQERHKQQELLQRQWRDRVATFLLMGRYLARMRAGLHVQVSPQVFLKWLECICVGVIES